MIFRVLIDRPVLALMLALALVLVGGMAASKLPLRFFPDGMSAGRVNIWVPIMQARSPRQTEEEVVRPTEALLRTIPGISQLRSKASANGARFWIDLNEDQDPVLAGAEVRDRIDRARMQWPDDIEQYFSWREDASSAPLAFFQILTPERSAHWDQMLQDVIKPRLDAVDGIGRVDLWGDLQETIRIWFDRDKLLAQRVDYRRLLERLAQDNITQPVGELESNEQRLLLRVDSKFRSLDDIRSFPVRPGLCIADIARVVRVPSVQNRISRFNGSYTFSGAVRATAGANPVAASDRMRAACATLEQDPRMQGMHFRYVFDQGEFIRSSLDTLRNSALQGGCLALLILLLALRRFRFTLAIGLAIPLTLLIVSAFLYFQGNSLNILSMAGMTLAVGMVVDNSVVVLESIRRRREHGLSVREACIEGSAEVGLAVTMATLTTVVVFLPMIFMGTGNQTQVLFGAVGIPLSVALLGSLFVALFLLPAGLCHLGGLTKIKEQKDNPWSPVLLLLNFNHWLLRPLLKRRYLWLGLLSIYVSLMAAGYLPKPIPKLDLEARDQGPFRNNDIQVNLKIPKGKTLTDVRDEVLGYERFLFQHQEEWQIESVSCRFDRSSAAIDIKLDPDISLKQIPELSRKVKQAWPRRPGIEVVLTDAGGEESDGAAGEDDQRNFVLRLRGRDSEHLAKLALRLQKHLALMPEVASVEASLISDNSEVQVTLQRDRMQELGVQPEVLFSMLRGGLQGQELRRFAEAGREIPLITQFDAERNPSLADLRETEVFSSRGNFQDLESLSQIRFQETLDSITRLDGRTTVSLVGQRKQGIGPRKFSRQLQRVMQQFALPSGYAWSEDSMSQQTELQLTQLAQAGILSIVLVFLLMGILFESVILPAAILITVVLGITGANWALYFFYNAIDPMAVTGMILLSGVVVNNGIVLLDCIQKLRNQGMPRQEAIFEGIRIRLRPIALTAMTTVVGLLPMALFGQQTGSGISYVSMSIAVIGGLCLCTLLSAPLVALFYTYLDDLSQGLTRLLHYKRAKPQSL